MRSDTAKSPAKAGAAGTPRARRGFDRGEVAELADIHPEDRNRSRVHEIDRVEHRAVAAERDHQVESLGEALSAATPSVARPHTFASGSGTRTSTPCSPNHAAAAPARSCARPRGLDAERGRRLRAAGLMRSPRSSRRRAPGPPRAMSASTDDWSTVARRAARAKNSTCCRRRRVQRRTPPARTPSPRPRRVIGHDLLQHRRVHDRVAHDAALADAGPARFELRLHQQHEISVGGRELAADSGRPCATR